MALQVRPGRPAGEKETLTKRQAKKQAETLIQRVKDLATREALEFLASLIRKER